MQKFASKFSASLLLAVLTLLVSAGARAQQTPAAITSDPVPNNASPAAIQTFQLPSHGAMLNALVYVASGAGPHPVVILLHGFPGNEKNLDLAQAIRRAGWDVLYFDYRGSWGSPGDFSFTHCIEDTQAAIAYVRDPANAKKLRADPARIVLIGHSMGGFMANFAGAQDSKIAAVGMISAANLGDMQMWEREAGHAATAESIGDSLAQEGMAPLAGCTPDGLGREVMANHEKWDFVASAPKLASRPLLVVTSDDGLAPSNEAFVDAVKKAGNGKVTAVHMPTDHSYSDHRIALETAVLAWLAGL
jgi:pimeloyl-ACP methyl ester carboxylesterase